MTPLSGVYILTAFMCLARVFWCAATAVEAEDRRDYRAVAAMKRKAHCWTIGLWVMMIFAIGSIASA